MISKRTRIVLAIFIGTITGTIVYVGLYYLLSLAGIESPSQNWLFVGIRGFILMLIGSCCVIYFGRKWNIKLKKDKVP